MTCPYCQKETKWCENKEIYGRNYGKSYMCYFCRPCWAYVGCHQNTKKPLGTIANAETREWRKKVHAVLDPIWQNHQHKRSKRERIYERLSRRIYGKNGKSFHVGESDIGTCKKALEILSENNS